MGLEIGLWKPSGRAVMYAHGYDGQLEKDSCLLS